MTSQTPIRIAIVPLLMLSAGLLSASAQDNELRMIVAPSVVCHAEASASAAAGSTFRLGDIVTVAKQAQAGGTTWYLDDSQMSACWLDSQGTAPFSTSSPDAALVAMFDRLEKQGTPVSFPQFVEVANLLEDDFAGAAGSAILQFRKLKLIGEGLSAPEARDQLIGKDPLKKAWIFSHQDILKFFSPTDTWTIRPIMYWRLYDYSSQTPWADDLAQTAALHLPYKENCSPECLMTAIFDGPLQYWSRRPNGNGIVEALQEATTIATSAAGNACRAGGADSPAPPELVAQVRQSLATVTSPRKGDVLQALDNLEKCPAVR